MEKGKQYILTGRVISLEQACATHGPRATIWPPRAIAVARGDGRTVFFFYLLRKNPIRLMAEFTTQEIKDVVLLTSE